MATDTSPELNRLAEGLAVLAEAAGAAGRVESELTDLLARADRHEPLRRFLTNPAIEAAGKEQALAEILGPSIHPVLFRFLLILLDLGHIRRLREVAAAYFGRRDATRRETAGELVTARPLNEARTRAIVEEVGRILGRPVHLRVRVDPGLLGGQKVRVGDLVIDGTVDQQLAQMHRTLVS